MLGSNPITATPTPAPAMKEAVMAHPTLVRKLSADIATIADFVSQELSTNIGPSDKQAMAALRNEYANTLAVTPTDPLGRVLHNALKCMIDLSEETDDMRALRFALTPQTAPKPYKKILTFLKNEGIEGTNIRTALRALRPVRYLIPNMASLKGLERRSVPGVFEVGRGHHRQGW